MSARSSSSEDSSGTITDRPRTDEKIIPAKEKEVKATYTDSDSFSSKSSKSDQKEEEKRKEKITSSESIYSESDSTKRSDGDASSVVTGSEGKLLQSILSDTSSEKISTDIEVTSPKEGKFSSSTDEELLRKFRQQQANRRFRPQSAKIRHNTEPEPEPVNVNSSRKSKSSEDDRSSSDTSTERSYQKRRKRPKLRKKSSSSGSEIPVNNKPEVVDNSDSVTGSRSSTSRHSKESESERESSSSTSEKSGSKPPEKSEPTSESLTTSVSSLSSTVDERPATRLGRRPKQGWEGTPLRRRKGDKRLPQLLDVKSRPIEEVVVKETVPLRGPGFPWPYNEDRIGGEKEIQRLIKFHKDKLNRLLAQEYLQRNLELELRKAGAQFRQYEREPRNPLTPSQIRKFREQEISWVYLDGKLFHLANEMGLVNEKQRGRKKNKITPNTRSRSSSSRRGLSPRDRSSTERSKRSVSFDASARGDSRVISGRKGSYSRSSSVRSKSRSSSRGSRKSSRGSSRSRRSSSGSKVRFSDGKGKDKEKRKKKTSEKVISVKIQRPTTAKPKVRRVRSASSTSRSSVGRSDSESESRRRSRSSSKEKHRHWYSKLSPFRHRKKKEKRTGAEDIKEETAERVTEQNGKKSRKNKTVRVAIEPQVSDYPSVFRERKSKSETRWKPTDDYNFYRDPNIPGHAFPYYYLSYLISMDNGNRGGSKGPRRVTLVPAPVHGTRPRGVRPKHRKTPTQSKTAGKSPNSPPRRERKTKSVIDTDQLSGQRSTSRDSRSSSANRSTSGSHPLIRPGSGPIKCSWKKETDPGKPKYPGSDHQLKDTDNPVIKEWLRRKDAQLRARKICEVRKQRRKTAKLIDEQNDKDEKHERALEQYEIWKRKKDREILLRRRTEAREANSAAWSDRVKFDKRRKQRPRTAPLSTSKNSENATFAELRSSSASPVAQDKKKKPRPKSANTSGVSFSSPEVTSQGRPKSSTPPRTKESVEEQPPSVFSKAENFFKSFMGSGTTNNLAEEELPRQSTTMNGTSIVGDRNNYDKWVRAENGSSKDRQPRRRSAKRAKSAYGSRGLPPHNHEDNNLISSLAKRRIDSILANRKRVDSGIPRRARSSSDERRPRNRKSGPPQRWKLRDGNVIEPSQSTGSEPPPGYRGDGERPKFTYVRKSTSGRGKHERNPVVREALGRS